MDHLEETIGPRAAQDFEQAHPETDDVDELETPVDPFDTDAGLIGRKYVKRVAELEAEGMTTSDAQAAADAELIAIDEQTPVEPAYESRTDQTIRESGVDVDPRDRSVLAQQATRAANMNGGRYSDELRSELRTYEYAGRDQYLKLVDEGNRVARTLGYVR